MDEMKPLGRRRWFVATICVIGLVLSWASYWAVSTALPPDTRLAHWALELLILAATGGFLLITERLLLTAARHVLRYVGSDGDSRRETTVGSDQSTA